MRYMVSITFVSGHQSEITALLPDEKAYVQALREKGTVEDVYLSHENGSRAWIVMKGESREEIQRVLEAFPLYPYMVPEMAILS